MAPLGHAEDYVDYYELLGIPVNASESEIRRAYRKTSLLYHPDKVTPTPETLEKFQLLQTAINVLSDAAEKVKYDQTRETKQRRLVESAALEGRRRKMKEDLEKRETGAPAGTTNAGTKRSWSDRELEVRRIAEENRKRREVASAKRMHDVKVAEEARAEPPTDETGRSIKVRWVKEGEGLDIDDIALTEMYPVGHVENVFVLKDKKRRLDGRDKKVVMGTAVLIFRSLAAAKMAVAQGKIHELESVGWAAEVDKDAS